MGLGLVDDNHELIEAALRYLKRYNGQFAVSERSLTFGFGWPERLDLLLEIVRGTPSPATKKDRF